MKRTETLQKKRPLGLSLANRSQDITRFLSTLFIPQHWCKPIGSCVPQNANSSRMLSSSNVQEIGHFTGKAGDPFLTHRASADMVHIVSLDRFSDLFRFRMPTVDMR